MANIVCKKWFLFQVESKKNYYQNLLCKVSNKLCTKMLVVATIFLKSRFFFKSRFFLKSQFLKSILICTTDQSAPDQMTIPLNKLPYSIQETSIALAILHASCQVHCNPSRKTKVLGTPRSQLNQKKNTTLASDTEPPSQVASEQSKIFIFST